MYKHIHVLQIGYAVMYTSLKMTLQRSKYVGGGGTGNKLCIIDLHLFGLSSCIIVIYTATL